MIQQLRNSPRHRIRHVLADTVSIEADFLRHRLTPGFNVTLGFDDNSPRNPNNRRTRRHRLGDDRIRAHFGACTHRKWAQHLGARTDDDTVLQRRMALAFVPTGATQGYTLIKRDVITDLCGLADHNPHPVINEETTTHLGTRMNFNTCHPAAEVRDQPRHPLPACMPQPPRQSMKPDGVHARVTGQHFKRIARSRIAMKHTLDIFTQTLEHL